MKVPYRISDRSISVMIANRMRVIDHTSMNYAKLAEELRKPDHDVSAISELVDITSFVARVTHGKVQIADDGVRWNGQTVHNVIADRLIAMLKAGDDLEPLALFLDRLMRNPIESARDELYLWLEAGDAPITPDGHFLAFKAVRSDYKDKHSGTIDNSVGRLVQMPPSLVDADRRRECSTGLHFCQYGYLSGFASSNDKIMILMIDPADVVAIPHDYHNQKGRTWRYMVTGEVPADEVATIFTGRNVDDRFSAALAAVADEPEVEEVDDQPALPEHGQISLIGSIHLKQHDQPAPVDSGIMSAFDTMDTSMAGALNAALQAAPASPAVQTVPVFPVDDMRGQYATKADKGFISNTYKTSDGRVFTRKDIKNGVKKHGQRGFAKLHNVPRSTLQGWLAQIAA